MKIFPNTAYRNHNLGTETAFSVLARANRLASEGKRIINLGIGQPDFQTPEHIVEAGIKALRDGHHGYTQSTGIPKLREAVSDDIKRRHDINIAPDNILIVPGGKVIIFFSAMLMGEKNKEILYPNPGFPIYESAINYSGAKAVPYKLSEDMGFSFSADDILKKINKKTSLIIINSPANPTGGVVPKKELEKLANGLQEFPDVVLMSDEIYDQFCFGDNPFTTMLSFPEISDRLIILNGWSKTYAMTGWRLGYGIFPTKLYEIAEKLAVNIHSCVNASAQFAALEALKGPQSCVSDMNNTFKKRADIMYTKLNEIDGFNCQKPKGAFYCFPNITGTNKNATEIQNILLDQIGVATVAGTSFGKFGEGYIRLSCANSEEAIEEAILKIKTIF
ncbi:pyridoxal phosphate-dependent aminotransferase [Alphaproteobacteria bacterium]|nr:pyridoxal phosphate-dependent aminotransferase [Alphaproteobacteria bacterium]MDC1087050.1 pyridoxal phosphate-dependent aminotransferase [Alphaproteobacteria bacterium]